MTTGAIYKTLMGQIRETFSVDALVMDFQEWVPGGRITVDWYSDVLTGRLYGLIDAADALGVSGAEMQKLKDLERWAEDNIMKAYKVVYDSMNGRRAA